MRLAPAVPHKINALDRLDAAGLIKRTPKDRRRVQARLDHDAR